MTNDNSTDTHGDLGSVLFVCLWIFKKQSVGQILVFLFFDNIAAGEGEEYSGGQESG